MCQEPPTLVGFYPSRDRQGAVACRRPRTNVRGSERTRRSALRVLLNRNRHLRGCAQRERNDQQQRSRLDDLLNGGGWFLIAHQNRLLLRQQLAQFGLIDFLAVNESVHALGADG